MGGPRAATNHRQGCRGSPAPEVSGSYSPAPIVLQLELFSGRGGPYTHYIYNCERDN